MAPAVVALLVAAISLVLLSSALLLIFYLIFCITDNHLVPTIEVFIKQFEIPETVAAVTLVAFGSATPELLLQSVAAIENTNDISLSAILGSAMIAFGLIPPLCLLSTSHVELRLLAWPVIRETCFYILGLSVFLFAIIDGVVTTEEVRDGAWIGRTARSLTCTPTIPPTGVDDDRRLRGVRLHCRGRLHDDIH